MKFIFLFLLLLQPALMAQDFKPWAKALEQLSVEEKNILVNKGTERAFSGKYVTHKEDGTYLCKLCKTPLFISTDKFSSHCGWPSFDDAIKGAVKQVPDRDGRRTEILCANCGGHLGHIFKGEGFTAKNQRFCVNSLSLDFNATKPTEAYAYFAGGCFWGVEYYLEKVEGVKEVISGFMGGAFKDPSYKDVIYKDTGHLETVEVRYDPNKVSYEQLAKTFFEIHDPTQTKGQGPDIGSQYLSAIFVSSEKERRTVEHLVALLEQKGLKVATKILDKKPFYKAEAYHQDYYEQKGGKPYCHVYIKRFDD
ncbi:MAG: bifunctional methionine sulfoxide reductase B/A protein [Epsilonproteobacteria bacterium]|nr:bifunctional methionine sulfoxide reductase B/A protein [Campylobacterota bacterium]